MLGGCFSHICHAPYSHRKRYRPTSATMAAKASLNASYLKRLFPENIAECVGIEKKWVLGRSRDHVYLGNAWVVSRFRTRCNARLLLATHLPLLVVRGAEGGTTDRSSGGGETGRQKGGISLRRSAQSDTLWAWKAWWAWNYGHDSYYARLVSAFPT